MKKIAFTGGGSAGHVVPNLALIDEILKNGKTDECYHPETGEPIMGQSFLSWNSLIVDMINQIR